MILKLGKFEIFSVNVTQKLGGYFKFPEEGNFIGQRCVERPMFILRPFRAAENVGHVLCKTVPHRTVEPPLFPGEKLAFKFHW